MPSHCGHASTSPAAIVPRRTPVTGLSRPTIPTVAAGSFDSPTNHAQYASAVATSVM